MISLNGPSADLPVWAQTDWGQAKRALTCANDLLGRAALQEFYDREGYLFFREVVPADILSTPYRRVRDVLLARKLATETAEGMIWSGSPPQDTNWELATCGIWEEFVGLPAVRSLFAAIIGDDPVFVNVPGFETMVPGPPPGPAILPHQDGLYVPLLDLRTFWIPLVPICEAMGGIALAAGSHKRGWLQDVEQPFRSEPKPAQWRDVLGYPLIRNAVPADSWRRTDYRPGDLLVFHPLMLHAGLGNRDTKGRIRISFNVRGQPRSSARPDLLPEIRNNFDVIERCFVGLRTLIDIGAPSDKLQDCYARSFRRSIDPASPSSMRGLLSEL